MDLTNSTAGGSAGRAFLRPAFVGAILILGAAAFGLTPMVLGGRDLVKKPVPLKAPLREFRKENLGPYRFQSRSTVSEAVIDQLGTKEFIDWTFEDTDVTNPRDPLRYVHVHVPYYTGGRNVAPHVPDNCRRGQGYVIVEQGNTDLMIPSLKRKIPVRVLTFETSSLIGDRPTVIYTFHCNGDFAATRNAVRLRTSSFTEEYAYFCKIEVSFGSMSSHPLSPDRESAVKATAKFLNVFLPRLLADHLPDWQKLHAKDKNASHKKKEAASA